MYQHLPGPSSDARWVYEDPSGVPETTTPAVERPRRTQAAVVRLFPELRRPAPVTPKAA
jgi:hypothetical protein